MMPQKVSKQNMFAIILFAYVLSVTLEASANETDGADSPKMDGWQDIHNKIYSSNEADAMRPEQVLAKLKELARIYEPFDDKQTEYRKTRINTLIECSIIDLDRCSRSSFSMFKRLREINFEHAVNVIPYLDYYSKQLFAKCYKSYETLLKSKVQQISDQDKADIEQLNQVIATTKIKGHKLTNADFKRGLFYEYLIKGTIQFMSQKLAKLDNEAWINDEELYRQHLDEYLIQTCLRFHTAVDPFIAMDQMGPKNRKFTDGVRRLVKIGSICGDLIVYSRHQLPYDTFKRLVRMVKVSETAIARQQLLTKLGDGDPRIDHLYDDEFVSLRARDVRGDSSGCLSAVKGLFKRLFDKPNETLTELEPELRRA